MATKHTIFKEYKHFNYPNRLVGLELYYYYLYEYDLLPKTLPKEIVMKLFRTISQDFLKDYMTCSDYEVIMQQLFYKYLEHTGLYEDDVFHLFTDASDMSHNLELYVMAIRRDLTAYFEKYPDDSSDH
ncbi:hypothetical protein BH09PAT1_BH09PAT1_5460 [soil metagenome]